MSVSPAGGLDLEQIAARLQVATPGPWMIWPKGDERESVVCERAQHTIVARCPGADGDKRWEWGTVHHPENDAALIAHAPEDIAALLREVEALRTALRPFAHAAEFGFVSSGEVTDEYGLFAASPEQMQHDMAIPLLLVRDLRRARELVGAPERDL